MCIRVLGLLALLGFVLPASGQQLYGQPVLEMPQVLGRGGAAGAYPSPSTALYYNPAHLTRFRVSRSPITLFGASVAFSDNVFDQLDFYHDELEPAIDRGIDNLTADEEQKLYADIFELGRRPSQLVGTLVLPSFVLNRGTFGFGGGLFLKSTVRGQVGDAGSGIPFVHAVAITDAVAIASVGVDLASLGVQGLSTGATVRTTQRFATVKQKPVDALTEDENFLIFQGLSFGLDLGLAYELPVEVGPGRFMTGATWVNAFANDFDYSFSAYFTKNSPESALLEEREQAFLRDRFQPLSTYRLGVSYIIPQTAGPLRETMLAADLVGAPEADLDRSVLTRFSLGAQTSVNDWLYLRTGVHQGQGTVGLGLRLPLLQLDYAYYGIEEGRFAGQLPSRRHRIQLVLGSY